MERRKLLSLGGAVLATSAILGGGIAGCGGGSTEGKVDPIVGQNGTGGGAPTAGGAGGSAGSAAPAAAPGTTIFAESYGDEGEQGLSGMAVDAAGNIYVAGNEAPVSTSPSGSPPPLTYEGTAKGAFLLQYSPTGELMWRQPFVAGTDPSVFSTLQITGVAVQPTTGLEILAGNVGGTVTISGTTLTSSTDFRSGLSGTDLWLTAIDSAGYLVWTKLIPSHGAVFPDQVFVTSSGDIEVTGGMTEGASVGGTPLAGGNGATGPSFIARFSPTGDPLWSYGIMGSFRPIHADADADGGIVTGGIVNGDFAYRDTVVSTGAAQYVVNGSAVLRLDPQGNKRWLNTYIASTGTSSIGAALDRSQNVVLFGQFNGPLDLGGGHAFTGPGPSSSSNDGLLAKLTPDGTTQWAQQITGGVGNQFGASVATNAAGDIAFSNTGDGFQGGPTFGGVSILPPGIGLFSAFVVMLAPDGTLLWTRTFDTGAGASGGAPSPPITSAAFDPSGRLAVSGIFDTTVDFGTGPLTAPGQVAHNGSAPGFIPNNVFTVLLAP
jgi:hypothetical protein